MLQEIWILEESFLFLFINSFCLRDLFFVRQTIYFLTNYRLMIRIFFDSMLLLLLLIIFLFRFRRLFASDRWQFFLFIFLKLILFLINHLFIFFRAFIRLKSFRALVVILIIINFDFLFFRNFRVICKFLIRGIIFTM